MTLQRNSIVMSHSDRFINETWDEKNGEYLDPNSKTPRGKKGTFRLIFWEKIKRLRLWANSSTSFSDDIKHILKKK